MVLIDFDSKNIIKENYVDILSPFNNNITDLVTESFFGSSEYRFHFYKVLQSLFNHNKKKVFDNEYKKYIDHIYFIFKGGNVIKAVIDQSSKKLNKESIEKIFLPQCRSDSDFSITCNYIECEKIFNNKEKWKYESKLYF